MDLGSIRPGHKKRAEKLENELRETVHMYQLVFRATSDVIYDIDLHSGTVTWNDLLYKNYGYKRTSRVNRMEWWISRIHPEDALAVEIEMSQWFEGNQETWELEYRFQKADGTYLFVRNRSLVQRTADGTPTRVIGSLQDVSKQRELVRAKDEFISLVSHQLRTPLTAIRVYSEMLTGGIFGPLEEKQFTPLEQISNSSIRLIKLVDDILSISRIELGNFATTPVPMNVNDIIAKHISELMPLAQAKQVVINFSPDTHIEDVPVDLTVLDQVVNNLLTNAIHYTKKGKGVVTISFTKNKKGYVLSVKDNGIGIPDWAKKFIFNRFFRADNAIKNSEAGTGIGLYMIKIMLDVSSCDITFDSTENEGTTFFVQIPRKGMSVS